VNDHLLSSTSTSADLEFLRSSEEVRLAFRSFYDAFMSECRGRCDEVEAVQRYQEIREELHSAIHEHLKAQGLAYLMPDACEAMKQAVVKFMVDGAWRRRPLRDPGSELLALATSPKLRLDAFYLNFMRECGGVASEKEVNRRYLAIMPIVEDAILYRLRRSRSEHLHLDACEVARIRVVNQMKRGHYLRRPVRNPGSYYLGLARGVAVEVMAKVREGAGVGGGEAANDQSVDMLARMIIEHYRSAGPRRALHGCVLLLHDVLKHCSEEMFWEAAETALTLAEQAWSRSRRDGRCWTIQRPQRALLRDLEWWIARIPGCGVGAHTEHRTRLVLIFRGDALMPPISQIENPGVRLKDPKKDRAWFDQILSRARDQIRKLVIREGV